MSRNAGLCSELSSCHLRCAPAVEEKDCDVGAWGVAEGGGHGPNGEGGMGRHRQTSFNTLWSSLKRMGRGERIFQAAMFGRS